MSKPVRVRFAPSPTGSLHIGGARTALFNWLFARRHNGTFILRIEDTDQERSTAASAAGIVEGFRWLGIDWDEGPEVGGPNGPYFQSERRHIYPQYVQQLLDSGAAYYCYCTPAELEARREEARRAGRPPRYDRRCANLTAEQRAAFEAEGRKKAVRLRVPPGETVVEDRIRGRVVFNNAEIDDFVIVKSDGMPTYNFAVVVDDHLMGLTHIIRAEEHLPNTPKQIMIYNYLGWDVPEFAHVSMILAPDRSKLSKRHGAQSIQEFRDLGFLPEAIINYIAFLGWSPEGDREIMSLEEMIQQFSLERINPTAAVYDIKKLTWMNGIYLREGNLDRIVDALIPFMMKIGLITAAPTGAEREHLKRIVAATRDRAKTLVELADAISYFYRDDFEYDEKGVRKHFAGPAVADLLREAATELAASTDFSVAGTESVYRRLIERRGINGGELIHPTRLAITGRTIGPGLFDVMSLLGRERTLARLARAIRYIEENAPSAD